MRVHFIHAHPEESSFVSALHKTAVNVSKDLGNDVVISDLYEMKFNPVISAKDFGECIESEHITYALEQRRAYESKTLAPDIMREVDKVLSADLLVFTFPIFWFSVPAILKGWIDRVFLSGIFYGGRRIYSLGGMVGKRALPIFTLGGRPHMFGENGIHGELESGMLRHFLQGTLGYVGLDVLEPFIGHHVPYISQEQRIQMLEKLKAHILSIDSLPVIPMPDLGQFDSNFLRKA